MRSSARENSIGFFERFLRSNVVPNAWHSPGLNGDLCVEPLNETAGLVWVVAFGDILLDQRKGRLGVRVKRNSDEGAGRFFWFLFEESDAACAIEGNGIVFF